LKDKSSQREQARLRKQKQRDKERQNSVTPDKNVTRDVTQETVPTSYVQGLNGKMYEALPERPRYLELSDGQVLDRLNQPKGRTSGNRILRMQSCNESSYNFVPNAIKHNLKRV
jgi:hypothetical protein